MRTVGDAGPYKSQFIKLWGCTCVCARRKMAYEPSHPMFVGSFPEERAFQRLPYNKPHEPS